MTQQIEIQTILHYNKCLLHNYNMLYKQETGLAGQEMGHTRAGHRVYNTVIQQTPITNTEN